MTHIYYYSGRQLRPNKAWTDDNGVQHPANWLSAWSEQEIADHGITHVVRQPPANGRFYITDYNEDGTTVVTPKPLETVKERMVLDLISQTHSLLSETDWMVTRASEDTASGRVPVRQVPANVVAYRDSLRQRKTDLESQINAATAVEELAAMYDGDQPAMTTWPEPPA